MKNTNETQTLSKVDTETSDIFFNFGAVRFNKWTEGNYRLPAHLTTFQFKGEDIEMSAQLKRKTILLMDAKDFLEIVHRPYLPEQLVKDFLDRE